MSQLYEYLSSIATAIGCLKTDMTFLKRLEAVASTIHQGQKTNSRIFVTSDAYSYHAATHFVEELQARFIAGEKRNRPDRPAIPAFFYPLISGNQLTGRDVLISFSTNEVKVEQAPSLFVSLSYGQAVKNSSASSVCQIILMHLLCEIFEPEFENHKMSESYILEKLSDARDLFANSAKNESLSGAWTAIQQSLSAAKEKRQLVLLLGNGGSCCDAQQIAKSLRAHGVLAFDGMESGFLTCCLNDGYKPFERAVEALPANSHVMLFSTSGNSENIISAAKLAKAKGFETIGMTGEIGGKLAPFVDIAAKVPSAATERIQEVHLALGLMDLSKP